MGKSTARRRSAREGTVYSRKDRPGYRGEITWMDPDGRKRRKVVSGATQQEARDRLDDERRKLRLGTMETAGAGTVGEYLAGWLERQRVAVRPSTWRTAEQYVRGYLIPALGRIQLTRLTANDVSAALARFVKEGRPAQPGQDRPPRPVSPVTAAHVRATLRAALTDAYKAGTIGRNVASDAKAPKVPDHRVTYLTGAEVARLLSATAEDALGPLYALAASTGLRRGELVGLRWSDVTDGALAVQRSVARDDAGGWSASDTKSVRSRRTLPLPAMARNALDRQRKRQAAARLAAGTAWQDRDGLVFTDAVGRPLLPEYVSHAFARARLTAGLPTATLHQLRHTAATMLLAEGVPLAVISDWLGHSSIGVTAKHYAAVVPALHRQAADALDRALSGGAS
jgi:integrase